MAILMNLRDLEHGKTSDKQNEDKNTFQILSEK